MNHGKKIAMLCIAMICILAAVCNAADTINMTGNANGMTLKAGDTLNMNGYTCTSIYVTGADVTVNGPGRVRVPFDGLGVKVYDKNSKGVSADNFHIKGVEISADSINAVGKRGIEALHDIKGLHIEDCTIKNIMVPVILRRNNGVLIEHSRFGPNNVTYDGEHCEALADNDSDNVVIRYNVFHNFMNSAIIFTGNDQARLNGTATNWEIHDNIFYYTDGSVAWGVGGGIVSAENGEPSVNWRIHHNTAINMQGWQAGVVLTAPTNCVIEDNLWYLLGKDPKGGPTNLIQTDQQWTGPDPFKNWPGGDFTITEPKLAGKGARWPFTGNPSPVETPEPTPKPTATPTPEPTATPTPAPTATPLPDAPVLMLYNSDRNFVGQIGTDSFPEADYSIAAEPPAGVNRVRFYLNGQQINEEGARPYMLGGDYVTRYYSPGSYQIGVSYLSSLGWGDVLQQSLQVIQPQTDPTDCAALEADLAAARDHIGELTEMVSQLTAANENLTAQITDRDAQMKALADERAALASKIEAIAGILSR